MSGIAAVSGRLSPDALKDVLQILLDKIERRGPIVSTWTGAEIALGQRLLPTTPEARSEGLPLITLGGRYQIALDGRIDNRRDLINKLALHNPDVPVLTDADLIVHAYDRWGVNCLEHMLGNFAFALWDGPRRRLFAARDQQGFRTLVFARTAGGLAIGSEPRQLLAAGIRDEIDQEFLARHLTGAPPKPGSTPYRAVSEVPPAHYLLADEDGITVREYWRPRPLRELRLKRREDYVEAVDAAFQEAVAAVLRSNSGAAILLSGGLDSSYVASVAAELSPDVRALSAYSATLDGLDEREYSRAVAGRLGMPVTEVDADECWSLSSARLADEAFDQPNVPMQAPLMVELARAGAAEGVDVLIDGAGGDEFFTGTNAYIAVLLTRGHFVRALNEAKAWSRRFDYPLGALLMNNAVLPLVPSSIREQYRSVRGRPSLQPLPCWVDPAAMKQLGLEGALDLPLPAVSWARGRAYRRFWRMHMRDMVPLAGWRERWAGSQFGLEIRSPLWDLRVIDAVHRVPDWVHRDAGQTKALMRAAMKSRLPELVTMRRGYGVFNQLMNKGLLEKERGRVDRALTGPLSQLPYINNRLLNGELADYQSRRHPWWHGLWRAITAGLWLDLNSVSRGHTVDRLKQT